MDYVELADFRLDASVRTEGEKEDGLLQFGARCTAPGGGGKKCKERGIFSGLQSREAWLTYLRASGAITEVQASNYRALFYRLAIKEGCAVAFTYDVLR